MVLYSEFIMIKAFLRKSHPIPPFVEMRKEYEFTPGHNPKKNSAKSVYEAHSSEVDLLHNKIQTYIFRQLRKKLGKDNVATEQPTGYGSQIDIVVRESDGGFVFYEIKTSDSIIICIREALGQLLEYAYYPNINNAKKMIIVSPNPATADAQLYLKGLRDRFVIPIYYQVYDSEKHALENYLY